MFCKSIKTQLLSSKNRLQLKGRKSSIENGKTQKTYLKKKKLEPLIGIK